MIMVATRRGHDEVLTCEVTRSAKRRCRSVEHFWRFHDVRVGSTQPRKRWLGRHRTSAVHVCVDSATRFRGLLDNVRGGGGQGFVGEVGHPSESEVGDVSQT